MKHLSPLVTMSACFALFFGNAFASDLSMFPNVKESKLSYAAYQAIYENQGDSKELPKIIVFSPSGKCVGVTDGKALAADKIAAFITDSLHSDRKACRAVVSSKFGVSTLGKDSGTGKPEIDLFIIDDFPFCSACDAFKQALLRESHSTLSGMQLTIMAVNLSDKS